MSSLNRRRPLCALPVLVVALACATPGPEVPVVRVEAREDPFLIAPLEGYPLTSVDDLAAGVEAAHAELRRGGEFAAVFAHLLVAGDRLTFARGMGLSVAMLGTATVLLAEAAYARGDGAAAVELLRPVVDELPDYTAAQLVLGRAQEDAGDPPAALEAFAAIAAVHPLAARRAREIAPRAREIVFDRLRDEVDRGRVEGAEEHLSWLDRWAPESYEALEGGRLVAVEKGDLETELEVVRRLVAQVGASALPRSEAARALRQREGELEARIGDVRRGLEILEGLARQHPDSPDVAEALDLAKFLWRLQLQPKEVQEIGRKGELDRADFATLLYWFFPRVRTSQISNPPIANDILDDPRRDVILRVLNLHLLEVDETLHRFEPAAPVTRMAAFRALLEVLRSSPRSLSCLGDPAALEIERSWHSVCRQAADCRLLAEAADCRPAASLSGPEALDLFRHTLDLLG